MAISNRPPNIIHVVIILVMCVMVTFFASWNSTGQNEEASQCDKYIYLYGGPCLEGVHGGTYKGSLNQKHRDVNSFILGVDSFHEAKQIFGKAQEWHSGDAAASESKICFLSQDRNQKVILVFASNSEMSSGKVDSVRFIQGDVYFLKRCYKTSVEPKNIRTKSGIHVGMSIDEFKKIMGEPCESRDGLLFYVYLEEIELKPDDPGYSFCKIEGKSVAYHGSGITARFVNGILQWVEIVVAAGYTC